MEQGLSKAMLSLYRIASGNKNFNPEDVCLEFSKLRIDEALSHNAGVSGKVPIRDHILEDELDEPSIEELLQEM
jgi:hypothetical protein